MSTHFIASPSSAERWIHCTGSLALITQYPQDDAPSAAAQYGTAVHELAIKILNKPPQSIEYLLSIYQQTGRYTKEQVTEAVGYRDYLTTISRTLNNNSTAGYEQKVTISSIDHDMFGTVDCYYFDNQTQHLHIIDLKTGRLPVFSINNYQLLLYAQGTIDTFGYDPQRITLHIYQDNQRCGTNTSKWELPMPKLKEFIDTVKLRWDLYKQGLPSFRAGRHCRYCPVRGYCSHYAATNGNYLNEITQQAKEAAYSALHSSQGLASLSTEKLAALWLQYRELQGFIETIETHLLASDPQDLEAAGISCRCRTAPLQYTNKDEVLLVLLEAGADPDAVAPRTLLSPSQLRQKEPFLFDTIQGYLTTPQETRYLVTPKKSKQNSTESIV